MSQQGPFPHVRDILWDARNEKIASIRGVKVMDNLPGHKQDLKAYKDVKL